ncbi:MAG: chromate transporter [Prevotella sp.]|nr:chromate transporter [Candidatus Equicola stercoris]
MIFLELFWTFFQIGLFGFGGGYGMLSMIQSETVVRHHWLSAGEFTNIVAVSQMTPGPIGINSATYCGYEALQNTGASMVVCILGSLTATFALVLPSLVLMIVISRFFIKFREYAIVEAVFTVLKPVVLGLLLAAVLMLMTKDNFGSYSEDSLQFFLSVAISVFAFIGVKFLKISPIRILLICGVIGLALFYE